MKTKQPKPITLSGLEWQLAALSKLLPTAKNPFAIKGKINKIKAQIQAIRMETERADYLSR